MLNTLGFARAVEYHHHSHLQAQSAQYLVEHFGAPVRVSGTLLDIGSGSGHVFSALQSQYPDAHCIALDLHTQLFQSKHHRVCADMHALPFPKQSLRGWVANLVWHWSPHPASLIHHWASVLSPRAHWALSIPLPGSLSPIRNVWQTIRPHDVLNTFIELHQWESWLTQAGLSITRTQVQTFTQTVSSWNEALRTLKQQGVLLTRESQRAGMVTPTQWQRMQACFAQQPQELSLRLGCFWGRAA